MTVVLECSKKNLTLLDLQSDAILVFRNKKLSNIVIHLVYSLVMLITIIPIAQYFMNRENRTTTSPVQFMFALVLYPC